MDEHARAPTPFQVGSLAHRLRVETRYWSRPATAAVARNGWLRAFRGCLS